jgi:hypothetical protein
MTRLGYKNRGKNEVREQRPTGDLREAGEGEFRT